LHQTESRRYGVDGTLVGTSSRTTAWWEDMSVADAASVKEINIFHTWAPDSFQTILDRWVAAGKSIAELVEEASKVAKVVTTFV
jgi:hypothetical protein